MNKNDKEVVDMTDNKINFIGKTGAGKTALINALKQSTLLNDKNLVEIPIESLNDKEGINQKIKNINKKDDTILLIPAKDQIDNKETLSLIDILKDASNKVVLAFTKIDELDKNEIEIKQEVVQKNFTPFVSVAFIDSVHKSLEDFMKNFE